MRVCNTLMENILKKITLNSVENNIPYSIMEKKTKSGNSYWVINSPEEDFEHSFIGNQLTDYEWHVNEIYLDNSKNIIDLIANGLIIVKAWKYQMENRWANTPFDICLSVDYGDAEIAANITLRFWSVRNGYHYIMPQKNELEKFNENAILIESVNYIN